jgi:predicted ester cyclase
MCRKLVYSYSFILVLSLAFASGVNAADPSLVGWWPLNEGGGETARDVSDSGNDGIISNLNGGLGLDGSVWVDDPERGIVISFNGTADSAFVRAGDIPHMTLTNDFTWAFWAKHSDDNTADNDIILGNRMGENTVDFVPRQFIKFTPTKFEWHMNGNGDDNLDYDDIPADIWLHHALVKTADQLTYYRNGMEASSGTFTQPLDFPQPLFFGGDNEAAAGENWSGLMSDVRTYNRALTGLDILAVAKGVEQIDMEIGFATQPPVIDGEVDYMWEGASTHDIVPGSDPANASGNWKVLYDSENLYVLVDIVDDILQNDSSSSWQDDSVEIYFDGGSTKVNTPLSGDDHQYTFAWTTDDIQGTNIDGATEGIEHAQVDTDTGWRIEIKLPWLSIQGIAPQEHDLIGIDCYYNDDDDGGDSREGKLLTFSTVEGWNDASQWGTGILGVIPEPVDPGTEGLVAYYALNGDVLDSSGNGNDGTIMDNPNLDDPIWIDGVYGSALEFHGTGVAGTGGDFIDCGNDASLDITGPISIALWIRPDADDPEGKGTSGGETAPMAKATSDWSWQVRYGWGGAPTPYMSFTFNTSPRAWASVGRNLERYEWCHIACSYDGTTLKCYLDGAETDSTPMGEIASSVSPVLIGSDGWKSDWTGGIDEVAIYNRDLSAGEIRYLAGERGAPDVEANKEVARRFFEEMWNLRDLDIVEDLITADMQGHAPTGEFVGYEGERQTILGTLVGFPDLQITIDDMIAEDNKVALLTSYHGTHTGTLMGQIPATGTEIAMTGGILFRFVEGKVAEAWSYADMLGLMQQIGAAAPPRPLPQDYAWVPSSQVTGDPGDPETNKALVMRFIEEVWNQHNLDPINELFHPEIIGNNPSVGYLYLPPNRETFTQSIADYLTAYPDINVTTNDIVAEGDKVMAYWTVNATHDGALMGIPPSGNPVTFSGHTMYRIADGLIVETWWAWDTMGMMNQITPPSP